MGINFNIILNARDKHMNSFKMDLSYNKSKSKKCGEKSRLLHTLRDISIKNCVIQEIL